MIIGFVSHNEKGASGIRWRNVLTDEDRSFQPMDEQSATQELWKHFFKIKGNHRERVLDTRNDFDLV